MGPSVNEATKIREGRSGQSHKRHSATRAPAKSRGESHRGREPATRPAGHAVGTS